MLGKTGYSEVDILQNGSSIDISMSEETQLRDDLARDRTALANERTFLSYSRTALALLGAAAVIFKFSDPLVGMLFGSLTATLAAFVFFWGLHSYRIMHAHLAIDSEILEEISAADAPIALEID